MVIKARAIMPPHIESNEQAVISSDDQALRMTVGCPHCKKNVKVSLIVHHEDDEENINPEESISDENSVQSENRKRKRSKRSPSVNKSDTDNVLSDLQSSTFEPVSTDAIAFDINNTLKETPPAIESFEVTAPEPSSTDIKHESSKDDDDSSSEPIIIKSEPGFEPNSFQGQFGQPNEQYADEGYQQDFGVNKEVASQQLENVFSALSGPSPAPLRRTAPRPSLLSRAQQMSFHSPQRRLGMNRSPYKRPFGRLRTQTAPHSFRSMPPSATSTTPSVETTQHLPGQSVTHDEFINEEYLDTSGADQGVSVPEFGASAEMEEPSVDEQSMSIDPGEGSSDQSSDAAVGNLFCKACKYDCSSLDELQSHVIMHSDKAIRKVCLYCQREYSSAFNLSRHLQIVHLGIKRFICPYCDRPFGEKRPMMLHMRSVHQDLNVFSNSSMISFN